MRRCLPSTTCGAAARSRTARELTSARAAVEQAATDRYSSSVELRRHSAQLQGLGKAVVREKRRVLAARNQHCRVAKSLEKKRAQHARLKARLGLLRKRVGQAADEPE